MPKMSKRAKEEIDFLSKKYNEIWQWFDSWTGYAIIPETAFNASKKLRNEVESIIKEETKFDGNYGRYVLYRSDSPNPKSDDDLMVPCYIVCQADIVD